MITKRKILILTANPNNTARLRLDQEIREIDTRLIRPERREAFELEQRWAVRIDDLRRALLDHEPELVHFSGHGEVEGIMVEDDAGNAVLVDAQGLADLFKLFKKLVKCVVLNACYSETQANAIHEHIDYVIGMNKSIGDKAAIEFSIGFYDALGAGRSYEDAFEFGCNAIHLHGIPEQATPVLLVKPGVAEHRVSEAQPEANTGQLPDHLPEANRTAYQIFLKKLKWLREQYAIDADPTRKFQLENQIEQVKQDLKRLEEW